MFALEVAVFGSKENSCLLNQQLFQLQRKKLWFY
jgi:hypothetical protein